MILLDFEEPFGKLQEQLEKAIEIGEESGVDISQTIDDLKKKIDKTRKEIYANLTPWQRVQVSRHSERPYTLEYINYLTGGDFIELHGDRGRSEEHTSELQSH